MITNDDFKARILKVNEDNILVLDRGVEDGVERGDHAKITNQNGFMARAIAVRAGMLTSHWKIYRVVFPEKISKDLTYDVTAINDQEVEEKYSDVKEEDNSNDYLDFNESELLAWGRKEDDNSVATDLPKDMLGDPILEVEPDFAARNFNAEQFQEDMKNWTFKFGIPVFALSETRKTDKSRTVTSNINITNVGKKYNFDLQYLRNEMKTETIEADQDDIDPTDGISTITTISRTRTDDQKFEFKIFNVIPRVASNTTYHKQIRYNDGFKASENSVIAPLGVTITVVKGADEESEPIWTLALNPGYTKSIQYFPQPYYDYTTGETYTERETRTFSLGLTSEINFNIGVVNVTNSTSWSPQISPERPSSWNTADVNINNELSITFPISTNLSGVFQHTYDYNFIPTYGPLNDQKQNQVLALTFSYSLSI